jgi:hypothetical protein
MRGNNTPHSLSPKPLPPPRRVNDDDLIEQFFKSGFWRQSQKELRWWEKPRNPLVTFVRCWYHVPFNEPTPASVAVIINRLTNTIRSRWSRRGLPKRLKTLEKKKQGKLFE